VVLAHNHPQVWDTFRAENLTSTVLWHAMSSSIDWAGLSAKLPSGTSTEDRKSRSSLWRTLDMNGNGYVSLAELDRFMSVLQVDAVYGAKPVMIRAFNASKGAAKTKSKLGADYVEKREFRRLLLNVRLYLEARESNSTQVVSCQRCVDVLRELRML
jgi:hypothetical protein